MKNIFLFDVESTELYGNGFAIGAVVGSPDGVILDKLELMSIDGSMQANPWVKQNVLPSLRAMPTCKTLRELRDRFWEFYKKHQASCAFWSDVNYPVETNFLVDVAEDDIKAREFDMPYPLLDVANFVPVDVDRTTLSKGINFMKHHPLHDAMASYYALIGDPAFKMFCSKLLM